MGDAAALEDGLGAVNETSCLLLYQAIQRYVLGPVLFDAARGTIRRLLGLPADGV